MASLARTEYVFLRFRNRTFGLRILLIIFNEVRINWQDASGLLSEIPVVIQIFLNRLILNSNRSQNIDFKIDF